MFELEINGNMYTFRFGMGFLRAINKTVSTPVPNLQGVSKDVGLNWHIAQVADGDVESLCRVLLLANAGETPRLTQSMLDKWLEDDSTNLEEVFDTVSGFFAKSNVTRKAAAQITEALKEAKAEAEKH